MDRGRKEGRKGGREKKQFRVTRTNSLPHLQLVLYGSVQIVKSLCLAEGFPPGNCTQQGENSGSTSYITLDR